MRNDKLKHQRKKVIENPIKSSCELGENEYERFYIYNCVLTRIRDSRFYDCGIICNILYCQKLVKSGFFFNMFTVTLFKPGESKFFWRCITARSE